MEFDPNSAILYFDLLFQDLIYDVVSNLQAVMRSELSAYRYALSVFTPQDQQHLKSMGNDGHDTNAIHPILVCWIKTPSLDAALEALRDIRQVEMNDGDKCFVEFANGFEASSFRFFPQGLTKPPLLTYPASTLADIEEWLQGKNNE